MKFSPEIIERVGNQMRVMTIISGDIPRQETKQQNDANYPPQPLPRDTFLPTGSTQVVYHRRDEGLLFAANEQPVRRFRSVTRETLQWRNPATGASLQVSYPSEQVELIPISAQ